LPLRSVSVVLPILAWRDTEVQSGGRFVEQSRQLATGRNAELAIDRGDVRLDGAFGDDERGGDGPGGPPGDHEPGDLALAAGQRRLTAAAAGHLAEAFTAGTKFAGGKAAKGPTEAAAEKSATGLARSVVTMVRRRIEDGTDAGEDVSARVGAAYREWRGERIERLVGDCALQSFSAGVLAAVTKKGTVRWVMTSTDGCSDCDDNALAGPVTVAEVFPTGHAGPPAHAGCRCLVAPTSA